MIKKIRIQNFKSIIDTTIDFNDNIFVLAGQNEAGKSSILEALNVFEDEIIDKENLNFEEESKGNLKQSVAITYSVNDKAFYECFEELCAKLVEESLKKTIPDFKLFNIEKLSKLKEFTLTRSINFEKDNEFSLELNEPAFEIIKASLNGLPNENENIVTTLVKIIRPFIDIKSNRNNIILNLWKSCPDIILFDDVAELLPDYIYISDLINEDNNVKGYKAVKNIEAIIGINFISLSQKSTTLKKGSVESAHKSITATFQSDWKQKIAGNNQVEINFELGFDKTGKEIITFYLKSKDGVYLEPRRRSKGLIWFLSLWLELKASESSNKIIFLFDEPGLNLHVKANNDMLSVFKKLAKNGHQIIYSTHSPSLIELDKLHNIGLVLNTEKKGTVVEGLTSSLLDTTYKKDALQPISEAMGLEPFKEFSILSKKNIIVEGLSDFWYYKGISTILNRKNEYKFVPAIGVKSSKLFPLISFCIGYGLEWVLIVENGENPKNTKNELLDSVFLNDNEEMNKRIKTINFKEVEDMFTISDFKLLDSKIDINSKKQPSEIIGKRKIIFARNFFTQIENGNITIDNINPETIKNFEEVFDFIDIKLFSN